MSKFIESTNLLNNENELRQQISRDGYLFFRSLIDKKAVLRAREDITNILLGANWLDAGTDPINAETSRILPLDNTKEYLPVYDKIQQQQSFHGLAHEPAIMSVIKNEDFKITKGKDKYRVEFLKSMADQFGLSGTGKKKKPFKRVTNVEGKMLHSILKKYLGI